MALYSLQSPNRDYIPGRECYLTNFDLAPNREPVRNRCNTRPQKPTEKKPTARPISADPSGIGSWLVTR